MATPIYDKNVLPCITYPFDNTKGETIRGLGGKSYTYRTSANININAMTDEEMDVLETFHTIDCNNGLDNFLLQVPLFGKKVNGEYPYYKVRFVGDFKSKKENLLWDLSIGIKRVDDVLYDLSPSVPANFTASNDQIGKVITAWDESISIGGNITYDLYKDGVIVATDVPNPYTYTLGEAGIYPFKVRANNAQGTAESAEDIGEFLTTLNVASAWDSRIDIYMNHNMLSMPIDSSKWVFLMDGVEIIPVSMSHISGSRYSAYFAQDSIYENTVITVALSEQSNSIVTGEITATNNSIIPIPITKNLIHHYPLNITEFATDLLSPLNGNATDITYDTISAIFNGTTSFIEILEDTFDWQDVTVSLWWKHSGTHKNGTVLCKQNASKTHRNVLLQEYNNNIEVYQVYSGDAVGTVLDATPPDATWMHTAISIDAVGNASCYQDGVYIGLNVPTGIYNNVTKPTLLGTTGVTFLEGSIAEVRIYSGTKTLREIQTIRNNDIETYSPQFSENITSFAHPAIYYSPDELVAVRSRIASPEYLTIQNSPIASNTVTQATATFDCGTNNSGVDEAICNGWYVDGRSAEYWALRAYVEQSITHANTAVAQIDAWASVFVSVTGTNAPLISAWQLEKLVRAVEILLYNDYGFVYPAAELARMEAYADKLVSDSWLTNTQVGANWVAAQLAAKQAYWIMKEGLTDIQAEKDHAVARFKYWAGFNDSLIESSIYLNADGALPIKFDATPDFPAAYADNVYYGPELWRLTNDASCFQTDGLLSEYWRDLWHTTMGTQFIGVICEMAYLQGYKDYYALHATRLTAGLEVTYGALLEKHLGTGTGYYMPTPCAGASTALTEPLSSSSVDRYESAYHASFYKRSKQKGWSIPSMDTYYANFAQSEPYNPPAIYDYTFKGLDV